MNLRRPLRRGHELVRASNFFNGVRGHVASPSAYVVNYKLGQRTSGTI